MSSTTTSPSELNSEESLPSLSPTSKSSGNPLSEWITELGVIEGALQYHKEEVAALNEHSQRARAGILNMMQEQGIKTASHELGNVTVRSRKQDSVDEYGLEGFLLDTDRLDEALEDIIWPRAFNKKEAVAYALKYAPEFVATTVTDSLVFPKQEARRDDE